MRREDDEALIKAVGARIRQLRTDCGLSLRECGRQADVQPFHLMAIELGQLAATTRTLRAIATVLGVDLVDLFNTENDDLGVIVECIRTNSRALETARVYATARVIN